MGDSDTGYIGYWRLRWDEDRTGWHSSNVNKFLVTFYPKVTGQELPSAPLDPSSEEFQRNSQKKWFIPLCGKTLDIPFLLSLGYQVFGVEGVKKAIETLDAEHNLSLKFNESRSVFEGVGGRLQIYCGDLFTCPLEDFGPFDFCWDRGSLVAVEFSQRPSYKKMLQRALSNHPFSYLLEVITYDKEKFGGPPRAVDDEDIQSLYGDWTNYQIIGTDDKPTISPAVMASIGKEGILVRAFLFTPKKS